MPVAMSTRKTLIVTLILGMALIFAAAVPSVLRRATRGTPITEYIREHGNPTATASSVIDRAGRLHGLRFDGVRLYTDLDVTQALAGRLLVYPESAYAIRHFGYLPTEQPIMGERSVHYSQRRLFGDESLVLVHVDSEGKVAEVERRSYNFLTLYESASSFSR